MASITKKGMEMDKAAIRPIYREFVGYLSQAPMSERTRVIGQGLFERYNARVQALAGMIGEDLGDFIIPGFQDEDERYAETDEYRQALAGLINHLYGRFFYDEPPPFSGTPGTIISQSQQQAQSIEFQLELAALIGGKLQNANAKEKAFLEKLKSSLSIAKDAGGLLKILFELAKATGLSVSDLAKLFGS